AVPRYELSRLDEDDIGLAQLGRADVLGFGGVHARTRISDYAMSNGLCLCLAQCIRLGLASPFGHGLGKIGENHREPKPQCHLRRKQQVAGITRNNVTKYQQRGEEAADLDHEHDGVARDMSWIEFYERILDGPPYYFRVEKGSFLCFLCHDNS